jgi:hypothetical protein
MLAMNRARVKKALLALAVVLVLIQIFQPQRSNPPSVPVRSVIAHVPVPPLVYSTLMRACGDCHSNQTKWPWYSRIAPLSWVVIDDVNQGRRHMNFDDWDVQENAKQENEKLADICKEISRKGMPPFSYRLLHKDLALNPAEMNFVCAWSNSFQANPPVSERDR